MNPAISLLAHALIGWTLCGAAMAAGMKLLSTRAALVVHAIAAPAIFALLTWVYLRWFGTVEPLLIAAAFVGTVLVLDVLVVAALIQRSFDMFASVLGTWLPFLLIFLASWITGSVFAGG